MTDDELKKSATIIVHGLLEQCVQNAHDPECAWIIFALAADTMERALVYTAGVIPSAPDYVKAKERLDRLLIENRELGVQTSQMTDAVLGKKRDAPQ